jgi:hypothetical protein
MHSFLFKSTLASNSALPFWKLLVSEFLLGLSETSHCSMSAPHVEVVPLLDVLQLLILFVGTLTYSEPRNVPLNHSYKCYNCCIMIIHACTYEYYPFSPLKVLTIAWVLI